MDSTKLFPDNNEIHESFGKAVTRLEQTRVGHVADMIWSKAQARESRTSRYVKNVVVSKEYNVYHRTHKREYVLKTKRVEPTYLAEQVYDSRLLTTRVFQDGVLAPMDDMAESTVNPFATVKSEQGPALGRLMDRINLGAIIAPVRVKKPDLDAEDLSAAVAGGLDPLTGLVGGEDKRKDICWLFKDTGSADASLFTASSLHSIEFVLEQKDVGLDDVVIFTPPRGIQTLRQDARFISNQNIYHNSAYGMPLSMADKVIEYLSFRIIRVSPSVLPDISEKNIATKKVASGTATILCKKFSAIQNKAPAAFKSGVVDAGTVGSGNSAFKAFPAASALATAHNAEFGADSVAAADFGLVATQKYNMAYLVSTKALISARHLEYSLERTGERADMGYEKQWYSKVRLGALLMDEDFAMAIPLFGKTGS